jgi:hypothetical protein
VQTHSSRRLTPGFCKVGRKLFPLSALSDLMPVKGFGTSAESSSSWIEGGWSIYMAARNACDADFESCVD